MKKIRIDQKNFTIIATLGLLVLLYGFGAVQYTNFTKPQVFFNLFVDNAFLIIMATGLAFVMISGGIDLSVGAVVAFTTMAFFHKAWAGKFPACPAWAISTGVSSSLPFTGLGMTT